MCTNTHTRTLAHARIFAHNLFLDDFGQLGDGRAGEGKSSNVPRLIVPVNGVCALCVCAVCAVCAVRAVCVRCVCVCVRARWDVYLCTR